MSAHNIVMAAAGGVADKLYSDDVFSSYLYTGNGSTQTITTGFQPDLIWAKGRSGTYAANHLLIDTARGLSKSLNSDLTTSESSSPQYINSTNSSGYELSGFGGVNGSNTAYINWVWKKAPKFFDVVTYTSAGPGASRPHNLGVQPGMVWIKRTDVASDWFVWHRGTGTNNSTGMTLNSAAAALYAAIDFNTYFTASTFNDAAVYSAAGSSPPAGTYVAYLFAHDTGTDGLIQCGSFTTDGSGNATVNLGWEPQFVLVKSSSNADNWAVTDSMRGMTVSSAYNPVLVPNSSAAENTTGEKSVEPTATGFYTDAATMGASRTYIYLAIRRPNKPPTTGTQVYNAIARTGTGAAATVTGVGFAPDLVVPQIRSNTYAIGAYWFDRLRGALLPLRSANTDLESTLASSVTSFDMDGTSFGSVYQINASGTPYINHFFKRAVGVHDQVCYTGTGVAGQAVSHGLGVAPELVILKKRNAAWNWRVYVASQGASKVAILDDTGAFGTSGGWNDQTPSATQFFLNGYGTLNDTYVAYLFATKANISKVGNYTGNGTSQTIDCGFTTGARFFLVKATSTTGSWWIFDSARGIISAADPALQLNSTAAEITSADAVDPHASGLIINQEATCSINATGVSYIFLAFS